MKFQIQKKLIVCPLLTFLMGLCVSLNVSAVTLMRNTGSNGEIDRIYHLEKQVDNLVEADSNSDTEMDQFVFIPDGRLVRRELDTDFDNKIEIKLYYVDEQLTREEQFNHEGQLITVTDYDDAGQILKQMTDSNEDGRFDLILLFIDGERSLAVKDPDNDGNPNIWETYENGMLVEEKVDSDEDNILNFIRRFDAEGHPFSMSVDNNKDGFMETFSTYDNGELSESMTDLDQDGRYEEITSYFDDIPVHQKMDRNSDGKFDSFTSFKKMTPYFRKADSNDDGIPDMFIFFKKGHAEEINESHADEVWEDSDGTGRFDRFRYYKKDKEMSLLERDINNDGMKDIRAFYDEDGKKEKVESDMNHDGRFDTWEVYGDEGLVRMEKDEDGNGKVNLVGYYTGGELEKNIKDKNSDGRFEITQWFNQPEWTMVMELDNNFDGNPEKRNYVKGSTIKIKEMDNNSDGNLDRREFIDKNGKVTRIEIDEGSVGKMNVIWHYNTDEQPILAEYDGNLDGETDTWYHYRDNMVTSIEEDTNFDGRPDLWEIYDESEILTKTKKDLDYDGIPDTVEDNPSNAEPTTE